MQITSHIEELDFSDGACLKRWAESASIEDEYQNHNYSFLISELLIIIGA